MKFILTVFLLSQVTESIERQDCLPGTFWNNVRCSECPVKYYQYLAGQNFCFACSEDRTTVTTGSYAPQQCLCNYGSYASGAWCIKCPKGTYSDELGLLVSCKPCPASTSTLEEGSTSMKQCLNSMQLQNCLPGNFYDSLSGECKVCPQGTYQNIQGKSQCNMCPPSTTTVEAGTADISQCICLPGHYRHAVSGTFSWCERCPYDHYQDETNQETCKPCPSGTKLQALGATSANQCIATGASNSGYCAAGQYLERKTGNCVACPVGTFNNRDGFNVCMRCSSLMTTRTEGSTSQLNCVCGPGTFLRQWCQNCLVGQYQDEYGQRNCKSCPRGYSTTGIGATSMNSCVQGPPTEPTSRCQVGHFLSMSGQCLQCSIGSYQDDRHSATCKTCPWGTTTLSVGATNIGACLTVYSGYLPPNSYSIGQGTGATTNNNQNGPQTVHTSSTDGATDTASTATSETSSNNNSDPGNNQRNSNNYHSNNNFGNKYFGGSTDENTNASPGRTTNHRNTGSHGNTANNINTSDGNTSNGDTATIETDEPSPIEVAKPTGNSGVGRKTGRTSRSEATTVRCFNLLLLSSAVFSIIAISTAQ